MKSFKQVFRDAANWIKPKHYVAAAVVSLLIVAVSFSGIVFESDVVGRLVFGFVWLAVSMGWIGQYFYHTR